MRDVCDRKVMAQLQRREPSPIYYGIKDVSVFEKIRQIGDGTHSKVYMARNRATGEIVALKKVKMEKERQGVRVSLFVKQRWSVLTTEASFQLPHYAK